MAASMLAHVRAMARNNAWSNARLLAACTRLSDEAFAATRTSFFPSLRETLNHIHVVDRYYLDDLRGVGRRRLEDEVPYPRAADLAEAQRALDRELIAFCDGLNEADLERTVTIDRPDGRRYDERIMDVLAHLFQHQIHHRGQAHAMLSGTQVPPPQLDEFFLAEDAPRRREELRALGLDDGRPGDLP